MPSDLSFEITSAAGLLVKLRDECQDCRINPSSSRHAINCALTAFHLIDWVWAGELKNNSTRKATLGIQSKGGLTDLVFRECPNLPVMREIATGSKHFTTNSSHVKKTSRQEGLDMSPWGSIPYDTPFLEVEKHNGDRVPFLVVAAEVLEYWEEFFRTRIAT